MKKLKNHIFIRPGISSTGQMVAGSVGVCDDFISYIAVGPFTEDDLKAELDTAAIDAACWRQSNISFQNICQYLLVI